MLEGKEKLMMEVRTIWLMKFDCSTFSCDYDAAFILRSINPIFPVCFNVPHSLNNEQQRQLTQSVCQSEKNIDLIFCPGY